MTCDVAIMTYLSCEDLCIIALKVSLQSLNGNIAKQREQHFGFWKKKKKFNENKSCFAALKTTKNFSGSCTTSLGTCSQIKKHKLTGAKACLFCQIKTNSKRLNIELYLLFHLLWFIFNSVKLLSDWMPFYQCEINSHYSSLWNLQELMALIY